MTPKEFVDKFYAEAFKCQMETGINAVFTLAQGAIESAWGRVAPGNNFFGVKDTDGVNGNEILLTTTEYHSDATHKYPSIISITPVAGKRLFKYVIKDYFRAYKTPEDCFTDHAKFFLNNKRYAEALKVKNDPNLFADAIAKAGYATDPNYAKTLRSVIRMIEKLVPQKTPVI